MPGLNISRPRKLRDLKDLLSGSGFRLGGGATGGVPFGRLLPGVSLSFMCFVGSVKVLS